MSLLISALQKAEQARKQSVDKADVEDFLLELAPQEESQPDDVAAPASVNLAQENASRQRAAAQLLAAKASAVKLETRISPFMLGLLLLSLLLMIGAGVFWYLSSLTQPEVMIAKPVTLPAPSTPGAANNATTEDASAETLLSEPLLAETDEQTQTPASSGAQPPLEASPPRPEPVAANPRANSQAGVEPAPAVPPVFGEPVTSSEASRVSVSKNRASLGVSRDVMTAYEAFNRGDDQAAQQAYRQALQADVRNIDALLGMAAVAARQGRQADAVAWYGKVLELEPRNSVAQTALLDLQGQADPQTSESRLKTMISANPQAAHLHAALGQLYISQGQWPLAQQSFFEAHHLDATHPDYAFNLAVSLDHMGKSALALQYYLQAQALMATHAASSVNPAQLATRIQQLQ